MYPVKIGGRGLVPPQCPTPRTAYAFSVLCTLCALVYSTVYTVQLWFSTWGTRVICDTLTQKIVTLRLYFYVTLLTHKYKENDT